MLPLLLLSSCRNDPSFKYANNKFITENGTTYVNIRYGTFFRLIFLKADGTGSATNESIFWEFHYIIDKEVELYFPIHFGQTLHYTFSIGENGLRQMTDGGSVFEEFTGKGYLN